MSHHLKYKNALSDIRNNFSAEYKRKGLEMRAKRLGKSPQHKALGRILKEERISKKYAN